MYDFINYTASVLKPDFFVWLGDNTGHNVWQIDKKDHLRPVADVSKKFEEAGYGKLGQMYPVLGNHEGMPCDEFDLYSKSHQWILDNTTETWKNWLTKDSQTTHKKTGCYSQLHPGTNLRIIGLNPLAADMMNPYLWRNATNPWGIVFYNCVKKY